MSPDFILSNAEGNAGCPTADLSQMSSKVLFVTSEMTGLLKVGGLGEISAYLPQTLRRQGVDVRVLIPGYREILTRFPTMSVLGDLPFSHGIPRCQLGMLRSTEGLVLYVVLCPELYDHDGTPYVNPQGSEWTDNDIRFAHLGLAAADIVSGMGGVGWRPDLLHVNDWPSALAPAYLAWRGDPTPSILTVHNLAYQGLFDRQRCPLLGIPDAAFQTDGVEFHGKLSFLKAGLFYASHLTTVSPTYAREILTPEMGCGMDGLLRARADRCQLTGILNGIDDSYSPQADPHLEYHFDNTDFSGKQSNATNIRASFGIEASSGPLFALVSRLVHQKGVDFIVESVDAIVQKGGQVVAIGQGEQHLEQAMTALAGKHPDSVGVRIGFDEQLARRIYAGSDFLLMPSRFEPCGLSQMYAQRFGSLPIAHRTGGLADTIRDDVTGFLFDNPSARSLLTTIDRAIHVFRSDTVLERMTIAAMTRPAGWNAAALGYQAIHRQVIVTY
jgi:starch synthase